MHRKFSGNALLAAEENAKTRYHKLLSEEVASFFFFLWIALWSIFSRRYYFPYCTNKCWLVEPNLFPLKIHICTYGRYLITPLFWKFMGSHPDLFIYIHQCTHVDGLKKSNVAKKYKSSNLKKENFTIAKNWIAFAKK